MEVTTGAAPAGSASESGIPGAAQTHAATANALTGGDEGGTEGQAQEKTFTQKELDEILQKRLAKAEAKAERRVLRTLERFMPGQAPQQHQQTAQPAQSNDGKPSRAQFASDEAFVDALTDWKLEQRERAGQATRQQEQQRTLAQKTDAIYAQAQKLPGFDRETFDDLPLTRPMVEALIDSDEAAKLMHYMASNPEEVERIAKLSPARQAAELGKLEAKATEAKPLERSNAPRALAGAKGSAGTNSMPDPTDTKAYIRWANEQERGARR